MAQQPRQVCASHKHWPCAHRVPLGHWPRWPQEQVPNWLQESATIGSHALQAWPFGPQAVTVRTVWHTPFWQQPCGQVCPLQLEQTPALQVPELPQLAHAWPPRPHCCAVCWPAVTQMLPSQQPAQLAWLQAHWPKKQSEPAGQGGPLPHAHWPCALHESARSGSQAMHAEPAVPQVVAVPCRHCGPEQQPLGQLVAVQLLQTPAAQVPPPGQFWHSRPAAPHAAAVSPARH